MDYTFVVSYACMANGWYYERNAPKRCPNECILIFDGISIDSDLHLRIVFPSFFIQHKLFVSLRLHIDAFLPILLDCLLVLSKLLKAQFFLCEIWINSLFLVFQKIFNFTSFCLLGFLFKKIFFVIFIEFYSNRIWSSLFLIFRVLRLILFFVRSG